MKECRDAFVRWMKFKDRDRDRYFKSSLRAHWSGADYGFADQNVQRSYEAFKAGWEALSATEAKQGEE